MHVSPLTRTMPFGTSGGFTVIEVLVALIVVGLLTAIALPSFQESIRKGRRSEAFAALASVQQAQERWRSNNSTYSADLSSSGLKVSSTTPGGFYTIAIDGTPTATDYAALATAASGTTQAADGNCARLRIRVVSGNMFYGSASASGSFDESAGNRCWSR